jgi:hypothetical protein
MAGRERCTTMNSNESNIVFIDYFRKDSFGNVRYYIKPERTAILIQSLIGKETISENDMLIIEEAFNVNFTQVLPPEEEV